MKPRTLWASLALTFAVSSGAMAQRWQLPGWPASAYTGVITPFGNQPSVLPTTWYNPPVSYNYMLPPQVVYVPVAVPAPRPAIEQVPTTRIVLGSGAPPADVRIRPGTVVTWTNPDSRPLTLVIAQAVPSGEGAPADAQSGVIPPSSSVSLAFNQSGRYRYYVQDRPEQTARIVVQ